MKQDFWNGFKSDLFEQFLIFGQLLTIRYFFVIRCVNFQF